MLKFGVGDTFKRIVDGRVVKFKINKIGQDLVVELQCSGKHVKNPEQPRHMHATYLAKLLDDFPAPKVKKLPPSGI